MWRGGYEGHKRQVLTNTTFDEFSWRKNVHCYIAFRTDCFPAEIYWEPLCQSVPDWHTLLKQTSLRTAVSKRPQLARFTQANLSSKCYVNAFPSSTLCSGKSLSELLCQRVPEYCTSLKQTSSAVSKCPRLAQFAQANLSPKCCVKASPIGTFYSSEPLFEMLCQRIPE